MLLIAPAAQNDPQAHKTAKAIREKGDYLFVPFKEAEKPLLEGEWNGVRRYYDGHLPGMRLTLLKLAEKHSEGADPLDVPIHIHLGDDLTVLYAAYYLALAGYAFAVSIDDPSKVGGTSRWAELHALLIRKLTLTALNAAMAVMLPTKEVAAALFAAFPAYRGNVMVPSATEQSTSD